MLKEYRITENGIVLHDKAQAAIDLLREFEPPEGYYLAFSGGKDSVVILDLVKRAGVKYDAHYNITTVDPPELVQFIKTFPEVERRVPKMSMWELIVHKRMPPTRVVRYCCGVLKEQGGAGRVVITGVRWAESYKRSKRRAMESCQQGGKWILNPIIDWQDEDVWLYIHNNNIPYCNLYDEGFKRLGCIMCPMQGAKGMLRDAERWPNYYRAYMRTFEKMLVAKREWKGFAPREWFNAERVMHYWIHNPPKGDPDQGAMFE